MVFFILLENKINKNDLKGKKKEKYKTIAMNTIKNVLHSSCIVYFWGLGLSVEFIYLFIFIVGLFLCIFSSGKFVIFMVTNLHFLGCSGRTSCKSALEAELFQVYKLMQHPAVLSLLSMTLVRVTERSWFWLKDNKRKLLVTFSVICCCKLVVYRHDC